MIFSPIKKMLLATAGACLIVLASGQFAYAQTVEDQNGLSPFSEAQSEKSLGEPKDDLLAQGGDNAPLRDSQKSDDSALPQPPVDNDQGQHGFDLAADKSAPSQPSSEDEFNPFLHEETVVQKTPQQVEAEIRDAAFNAALTGLMPMRPSDIRKLLEYYDQTRQAIEVPVYPFPKPELTTETISLDPGSSPPEIKVAANHVTSINILDVTGKPWPIRTISIAGNFDVVVDGGEGGSSIMITPMSHFAYGNIAISLLEFDTPIIFSLKTHRDTVQYRFDARIPEFGPYAQIPIVEGAMSLVAGDSVLNSILDGVPPSKAEKLVVSGVDGRTAAYNYNGMTYVRTPLTLLSPGWSASVSSADGMSVYAVSNAPVLLLSNKGEVVHAKLSEKKVSDE